MANQANGYGGEPLIPRACTSTNQKVGCSNHSGRTIKISKPSTGLISGLISSRSRWVLRAFYGFAGTKEGRALAHCRHKESRAFEYACHSSCFATRRPPAEAEGDGTRTATARRSGFSITMR